MTGIRLGYYRFARAHAMFVHPAATALIYRYHDLNGLAEAVGILPTDDRLRPALILGLNAGLPSPRTLPPEILSRA